MKHIKIDLIIFPNKWTSSLKVLKILYLCFEKIRFDFLDPVYNLAYHSLIGATRCNGIHLSSQTCNRERRELFLTKIYWPISHKSRDIQACDYLNSNCTYVDEGKVQPARSFWIDQPWQMWQLQVYLTRKIIITMK